MVFSSIEFVYLFVPAVLFFYYLPISSRVYKNVILLIGSILFYAWGEPIYVLLLIGSILINYFGVYCFTTRGKSRRVIFVILIITNIGALFIFKYLDFFIGIINDVTHLSLNKTGLKLPIGISFYTFQILSYVIDVYNNKTKVQNNIVKLALYVSMFPQLIAGPIVRYSEIVSQIDGRIESWDRFKSGLCRFIIGLAKKILIANNVALLADEVFLLDKGGILTFWLGAIAYTLQIYFDFSGYSDMAIGLGGMFGFEISENFNYPYVAKNVTDFWHRWHISLSTWFRDYVYIPLGGNRRHQILNLFIVWFCTGLWHGANWTFLIWGLLYFVIQLIEKSGVVDIFKGKMSALSHIYTMLIVICCWVIFRADNMRVGFKYIGRMFGINSLGLSDPMTTVLLYRNWMFIVFGVIASLPIKSILETKGKIFKIFESRLIRGAVMIVLLTLCTASMLSGSYDPFIYFNF